MKSDSRNFAIKTKNTNKINNAIITVQHMIQNIIYLIKDQLLERENFVIMLENVYKSSVSNLVINEIPLSTFKYF